MKDKILPPEYDNVSLEELTEKANKLIETLEKEIDLNSSVKNYQELLKLNNIIEKKFQNNLRSISDKKKKKIKKITEKNEKTA